MIAFIVLPVLLAPVRTLQVTGWRLDWPSLIAGLLLGAALLLLFYRFRRRLREIRDSSVSRVQETQAWVRAGVEKRFQAETARYVARCHLGRPWATLEQIFVPPLLIDGAPLADPEAPAAPSTGQLLYLWPELAAGIAIPPPATHSVRELLLNGRRVILSAPSGAGKTTLLAYCAHLCAGAEAGGDYDFLLPTLPIFVHLAELKLPAGDGDPAAPLIAALQQRSTPLTATGVGNLVRQKMAGGHALLLLDGWDELAPGQEEAPAFWLQQLLEQYGRTRVFVATAPTGYGLLLPLAFTLHGIAPWRARQARELGEKWVGLSERAQPPRLERFWQPGDNLMMATLRLWQELSATPARERCGDVPLLDRTLALVAAEKVEMPGLAAAAHDFWRRLALKLLVEQRLQLSAVELQQLAEETLRAHESVGRGALLLQTLPDSGLFRLWSGGAASFLSPVWRDYLAATQLAAEGQVESIVLRLRDPYWREVVRFFVACAGENNLSKSLLEGRRVDPWYDELFQLAGWLPHTAEGGEWRRQTLIQLGRLIVNPNAPPPLRQRAIAALAGAGDPGVPALLRQLLQRSDSDLRQGAAAALGRIDPDLAVPLLEGLLKDQDLAVRLAAVTSLGWQNSQRGEQPLLAALLSGDEWLSRAAAAMLADNGGDAWEVLGDAAQDEMPTVRRAAAYGLGLVGNEWAIERLHQLEQDPEWAVQSAAAQELEQMAARRREAAWRPTQAGDLPWLIHWAARRKRTVPAGANAIPVLCEVLVAGQQPEDRVAAAESLARVSLADGSRADVEAALRGAVHNDEDAQVRAAAFAALTMLRRADVRTG
jgi:HEAT repeat protein